MLPINNNDPSPCTPMSSNCVIWQGPDIECINLCTGDTISDVVNKLALKLCELIDETCTCNPDLSGLTLGDCIPQTTPLDLNSVLEAIMYQLCNLSPSLSSSSAVPIIALPKCLQYPDPGDKLQS